MKLGATLRVDGVESEPEFLLRRFIAGFTPRSRRAIDHLRSLRTRHLAGRTRFAVIDLQRSPSRAREDQVLAVLATPTLGRVRPSPTRRVIGDLSEVSRARLRVGIA